MFQQTNQGICFKIKAIPKAAFNQIVGWEQDELRIRLAATPEKGKANALLIACLAEALDISPSNIQLISGKAGRHKKVCVKRISIKELEERLNNA